MYFAKFSSKVLSASFRWSSRDHKKEDELVPPQLILVHIVSTCSEAFVGDKFKYITLLYIKDAWPTNHCCHLECSLQIFLLPLSASKKHEICSKLTIKTPERRYWRRSGVFIVYFEHKIL